jgi:cell wall-associated protease
MNTFLIVASLIIFSATALARDVIVEFSRPLTSREFTLLQNYGIKSSLFDHYPNEYFARTYRLQATEQALEILQSDQQIKSLIIKFENIHLVEGMSLHTTSEARNISEDSFSPYQWALHNEGQYLQIDQTDIRSQRVDSVAGQDLGFQSFYQSDEGKKLSPVIVAVLDSGVDYEHADLAAMMVRSDGECENNLPPFRATVDADNNGYVGDCLGWDFTAAGNGNNRPLDDQGHGTHIAGIIAAQWNKQFIAGIAPNARILAVKVLKKQEQNGSNTNGFSDRIAKGILYAVKKGAKVINLSLGWPAALDTQYLRQTFQAAHQAGVMIVAAAGNNSSSRALYPCNYSNVICVGATSINGQLASFSNYGAHVDILAPGEQILSTFPSRLTPSFFSVSGLEVKNGTSQASPYIAGILAVLRGLWPDQSPRLILARLLATAKSNFEREGQSVYGLANMSATQYALPDESFITPQFKDNQFVSVAADGKFTISLLLQNLSNVDGRILIKAYSQHHQVHFENDEFQTDIAANQDQQVKFSGQVTSFNISQDFKVCFDLGHLQKRTYCQEFVLARVPDFASETHNFQIPNELARQLQLPEASLKSIHDPLRHLQGPVYFWETKNAANNELTVGLWAPSSVAQPLAQMVLPFAQRIISILALDANGDGTHDYVAMAIGQKNKADGTPERFIIFSYHKQDGTALFSKKSSFSYYPEQVVPDLNETIWQYHQTDNGKMLLPVFMATGATPAADKNPDPFAASTIDSPVPHMYTLLPNFSSAKLQVHMLDHYKLREYISAQLSMAWYEDISLVGPLKQSMDSMLRGESKVLLSIGQGANRRTLLWNLGKLIPAAQFKASDASSHQFKLIPELGRSGAIDGSFRIPVTDLRQTTPVYQSATALVGLYSDTLARHTTISADGNLGSINYLRQKNVRDHIIGTLPSFKTALNNIYLYQTKSQVLAVYEDANKNQQLFNRAIHRSSFLPGKVFNEMFYPITMTSSDGSTLTPGLYIDSSQLYQGSVSVMLLKERGPEFLLTHSLQLPKDCRAMNPVRFQGRESFSILCSNPQTRQYKLHLLAF